MSHLASLTRTLRITVVWTLILSAACLSVAADEAQHDSRKGLLYKDKTSTQWIDQLQRSRDADSRSEAAEALGFIARNGKLTYGGFSDVPIDSEEPPNLTDEELLPIVNALVRGTNDSQARVKASAAIGVSWIGTRAKSAVPSLVRLLGDADADVKKNALTAIGHIGPEAKEAIPSLVPMLGKGDAQNRVNVAATLRLIGAPPEVYVPTLISILAQDGAAHYAAMELGQLGDPAIAALREALGSKNSTVRRNAAYAISSMASWDKLTKDKESVVDALIELTRDEDPKVVWCAAQAIGSIHASADRAVPALSQLLQNKDKQVVEQAIDSLGNFGAEAKPALSSLMKLLAESEDEHRSLDYAIRKIGINRAFAEDLRALRLTKQGSWLFLPLCSYPGIAIEFLQANPHVVDVPARDHDALLGVIQNPDPQLKQLQEALCASEHLPLPIIANSNDPRFLEPLKQRLKDADAYDRAKIEACSRACGGQVDRVVAISESEPGDFKPRSAWPSSDPARWSTNAQGHGDGITTVIVTGQIVRQDGKPAAMPKFYRVNDSMLLGEKLHDEVPIKFDPQTGRFVFITQVFAAYSRGGEQREKGPYQTGSSIVQIESEGCKPLQVRFHDEMPDVRITLSVRPGL